MKMRSFIFGRPLETICFGFESKKKKHIFYDFLKFKLWVLDIKRGSYSNCEILEKLNHGYEFQITSFVYKSN